MKLDKKGKLIINIFNYGKKHIARDNLWHKLNYKLYTFLNAFICIGIFNTEMKASKSISSHIYFFHPYGIVINSDSVIKDHVVIRQQVTIGNKGETNRECPIIKENVEIGAGAKIIGKVRIGKNSKIGANAVVTKSFPPNSILVGVPAKNISSNK